MAHTICLQYMEPGHEKPSAGYQFTDAPITLPDGVHVPRVGEFMQLVEPNRTEDYVVLAVNTRLWLLDGQEPGWTTYVTLGPVSQAPDQRLTIIRE